MKNRTVSIFQSAFSKFLLFLTAVLWVLSSSWSHLAQDKHSQQNYQPGLPWAISEIESINATNGNVMFNFGFGTVKGRGSAVQGISLKYNSKLYETHIMKTLDINGDISPQSFLRPDAEGGWQYDGDYDLRVINRNDDQDEPIQSGGGCKPPNYQAVYVWKLMMYFPDGSQHEFRPTGYSDSIYHSSGQPHYIGDGYFNVDPSGRVDDLIWSTIGPGLGCGGAPAYAVSIHTSQDTNPKMTYYSTDGTFMRLEIPNGQSGRNPNQWTLYLPDGSKVINGEQQGQNLGFMQQRVTDRNGNYVEKGNVLLPDGSETVGYIDQQNRWIARKQHSILEDHIYRLGIDGVPLRWIVRWKYITVIRKYTTAGTSGGIGRCCYSNQVLVAQFKVVDEIELPPALGNLKYTFSYNGHEGQVPYNQNPNAPNSSPGWGDLISLTLPSGAITEYDYSTFGNIPFIFTDQLMPILGKVKEKRLLYSTSYDGDLQNHTETWLYNISQSGQSTITGPDGGISTQYFYNTNTDNDLSGRVYKEVTPGGQIVERIWSNNKVGGCPQFGCGSMRRLNTFVKTEFTTIPNALGSPYLTAIKDFEFDKNGNIIKITEFDWVDFNYLPRDSAGRVNGIPSSAQIKRITETSYNNQTENASIEIAENINGYWNSLSQPVKNAAKTILVRDFNLIEKSATEIVYDNYNTKANPIEVRNWDSFKGGTAQGLTSPLNASNSILTTTNYDVYGNPTMITDANGNQTKITYGDINGFSGLYPTMTETAYGTPVQRTSTATYDFYTGIILSSTDVDNNITNATEYDAIGRPVKVKSAVGTPLEAWTRTEYDDVLRRVIVRSDLETLGDGKKIAVQHFDQLGRVRLTRSIENAATEDPYNEAHGIKVQTRYLTGNPFSYQLTSNPYRAATASEAANEESMGWTRSMSVNTGKHSEVETFSGAALPAPWGNNQNSTGKVRTDIDAERTLVTDQAGKQRISKTNALGQLVNVWEITTAGAGTEAITFGSPQVNLNGYRTSYEYDILNNLTTVNQGVQTRSFTYSSLSRLITANNPESGLIGYQYDPNGNLTQKTDARGVRTDYVYDALNRVLYRNYSTPNGAPANYQATPDVVYTYDDKPNAKGLLTKISNGVSTTEYTEFDILGRVKTHKQTTDGQSYTTGYVYNLSGAMVEQTYPSGRSVRNSFDEDGALAQVQSRRSPTDIWRNYANNFVYTAAGAVSSMQLGNGKFESVKYNSRLQGVEIGFGTSLAVQNLLKLSYDYGTTQNNGNVRSQTIASSDGAQPFVQNYEYDELNRLESAVENQNGVQVWKQTFTFDRYGNRNFDETNTTTLPKNCGTAPNFTVCPADIPKVNPIANSQNNRLNGTAYDPSGNTTTDANARTFVYDAENKQVQVSDGAVIVGQYAYDGDGKRVKKIVPSTGEVTVFVYDAGGKTVAEYSTILEPAHQAKTNYLTADHLGSPRIITNQLGQTVSKRDFMPYGEEIARPNPGTDSVRQKFTSYERDNETELDFAQARYYNKNFGRFNSADPLYFQQVMAIDPQRFNLYVYAINNPYKWTDPNGEEVRVAQGSSLNEIYQMVGGEDTFNQFFQVTDGQISLRDGADISGANQGVQFLNDLVSSSDIFAVYLGADSNAVARMFDGTVKENGDLNDRGEKIAKEFAERGMIVSTRGRRGQVNQPGGAAFTVLAINPEAISLTQTGIGGQSFPEGFIEGATQMGGIGQRVKAVSIMIHELAENLDFSRNGTHPRFSAPPDQRLYNKKATRQFYLRQADYHRGGAHYRRAHNYAIRREAQIRNDLNLTGGFAGGCLNGYSSGCLDFSN